MDSIFHSQNTQRTIRSDDWHSVVISGSYRAVIFDCDGTLVDSSETHFRSFQAAVQAQGHQMDHAWYASRTGLDRYATLAAFAAEVSGRLDIAKATRDSIQTFISTSTSVKPIPETTALVCALSGSHALAVGTNAEAEVVQASLRAVGLIDAFETIVSISTGLPAKPAPDIFLEATKLLGCSAPETLVFEDSAEGVQAAISAGLEVIQVL